MADKVKILVANRDGDKLINDLLYLDYSFSMSVDDISSTFSITFYQAITPPRGEFGFARLNHMRNMVLPGFYIQMWVNDVLTFTGIIQKVSISVDKNGRTFSVTGKDTASILVESYCTYAKDYAGWEPYAIINDLIVQTNFKVRSQVAATIDSAPLVDDIDGVIDLEAALSEVKKVKKPDVSISNVKYDEDFKALGVRDQFKVSYGDTVYSKISELVVGLGFNCIFNPATNVLFVGDLIKDSNKIRGRGIKKIINNPSQEHRYNNEENNVLSANYSYDISDIYTAVTVYSQLENGKNIPGTYSLDDRKGSCLLKIGGERLKKFMAVTVDNEPNPRKIAWQILEDQIINGQVLTYEFAGHTQDGEVWDLNRVVVISDEVFQTSNYYYTPTGYKLFAIVIKSIQFTYNQNDGPKTTVGLTEERQPYNDTN